MSGALVELTGSGRVDLGAERVVAEARLAIGDLGPLADVLAMPLTGSLDLHANVDGPLLQPEGRVMLEARGIEAAELRAERIETTVDFAALEALTQPGARMHLTAEGRARGPRAAARGGAAAPGRGLADRADRARGWRRHGRGGSARA